MTKIFLALGCVLGAVACSSADSYGTSTEQNATSCGAADVEPSTRSEAAGSRHVSFSADVLPILVASCAFGSCHGSSRGTNNGVFLGAKGAANDAAAIRAGLVGHASTQSPATPYVTPSDPSRSYLFRKLEGDMCGLEECAGGNCGGRMPRGGDKLDGASLDTIKTWIAQGAE
jgi:hypothetical protein